MSVMTLGLIVALACAEISGLIPTSPRRALVPGGIVVVYPGNMQGWVFQRGPEDTASCNGCSFVQGPATPTIGAGSADLATGLIGWPPSAGLTAALKLSEYKNTRFDQITDLRYANFRWPGVEAPFPPTRLEFVVDYDLNDQLTGPQGRIVFNAGFTVADNTWQTWDARAGMWWGTQSTVQKGGLDVTNPCVSTSPCTWSQLLAAFPNIGVHSILGAVLFEAPQGQSFGLHNNVDNLVIGVNGVTTTFDFELTAPNVELIPPDTVPRALFASLGTISGPPLPAGSYRRDIVVVEFAIGTPLATRQAAIDSVQGRVVGGIRDVGGQDGEYVVQITGGTTAALLNATVILQRQPGVLVADWWALYDRDFSSYRRPKDAAGAWRDWRLDPATTSGNRPNWALEYVRAPLAWGCNTGSRSTTVAVVDQGMRVTGNLRGNVDSSQSAVVYDYSPADPLPDLRFDHGTRVASVFAAVGNDSVGMTGMAWRTRLILRDRWSKSSAPGVRYDSMVDDLEKLWEQHVVAAGNAGADVINVSSATYWGGTPYDSLNPEHRAEVRNHRGRMERALAQLVAVSRRPLVVVSAGNFSISASSNGFAAAKSAYPTQILVVGGLDVDGSKWASSNDGSLVEVYAPAVNVSQARQNDSVYFAQPGTSFAAPLVAGTAALLKDFDPSLTSADLIRLIKAGARVEAGIPKLDAYQSLRQAALRTGGPICGNRLEFVGTGSVNSIVVDRTLSASLPAVLDTIIALGPPGRIYPLDKYHGGSLIDVGFNETTTLRQYTIRYQNGRWVAGTLTSPSVRDTLPRAWPGLYAWSHDKDSTITQEQLWTLPTYSYRVGYGPIGGAVTWTPYRPGIVVGSAHAYFNSDMYLADVPSTVSSGNVTATLYALDSRTRAIRSVLSLPNYPSAQPANIEPSEDGKEVLLSYYGPYDGNGAISTYVQDVYSVATWNRLRRTISARTMTNPMTFSPSQGFPLVDMRRLRDRVPPKFH